jgi:hypothetical protein
LDGDEAWVLVHVEVQGQHDPEFAERMYVYDYRCYDRFRRPVMSIAVLGDTQRNWRPAEFSYDLWGSSASLQFISVKLLDWEVRWSELERLENPFALIVMAHLKANATRRSAGSRYEWKLRIARALYKTGLKRDDVLELFRLLDWIMALPDSLEQGFCVTVSRELEEQGMPYLSGWERQGLTQGLRQGLQDVLAVRFENVPADILRALATIQDGEALRELNRVAVKSESLEAFRAALARHTSA